MKALAITIAFGLLGWALSLLSRSSISLRHAIGRQ
jgi:hypothetical protein